VLHRLDDAAFGEAPSGEKVAGVEHRPCRHPGRPHQPHRLVLVMAAGPFAQQRINLRLVLGAGRNGRKPRVVDQIGAADDLE